MQRKKNIRLLIILVILTVAGVLIGLFSPDSNRTSADRDLFNYDPAAIDQVVFQSPDDKKNVLAYKNGQWLLNDSLKADPQRVSVLFAILSQAKVRRKTATADEDAVNMAFEEEGIHATFFENGQPVMMFEVVGDEERGLTYYRNQDATYLMEIPGYRSYLAGIYALDGNGWRYPRIFDFNWGNLKRVDIQYAGGSEDIGISFSEGKWNVENLPATDTARLNEFLDNLSLLYVNDFLTTTESASYDSLKDDLRSQVIIKDVGNNTFQMDVLGPLPGMAEMLIRIDSSTYALASFDMLNQVLKPRQYFIKKEASE